MHCTRQGKSLADAGHRKSVPLIAALQLVDSLDEATAAVQDQTSDILQIVLSLPPKYRVVLYLYYYENYTTEEIAKLLKINRSAVTTRLSRAREALKPELAEV